MQKLRYKNAIGLNLGLSTFIVGRTLVNHVGVDSIHIWFYHTVVKVEHLIPGCYKLIELLCISVFV